MVSAAAQGMMTISRAALQALLDALAENHEVIGPTVRDGAIVYDRITRLADLPAGWTDHQAPGRYHLERRHDDALFGFTVGPQAWKRFLHRPVETLWTIRKGENGVTVESDTGTVPKFAFIGVRACELHAIAIQDRVFSQGPYPDMAYTMRRQSAFIVAVNCGQAGETCFCVSMETGPKAESGFDLALTELIDGDSHQFLVEVGSDAGAEILKRVPRRSATDAGNCESGRGRRANSESDGPKPGDGGNKGTAAWQPQSSALGRCRRALSHLRQLYDGVPDLFLHDGRRSQRSERHVRRAGAQMGFLLHHGFLLYPWRQRSQNAALALSAMDDAQARDLDRPVRHIGLRRLRPLHHVVPGRDRHHRRGGGDQGKPAAADRTTAWRALNKSCRSTLLRRRSRGDGPARRRLRAQPYLPCRRIFVSRGRAGQRILPHPPGQSGARNRCSGPRPDHL